MYDKHPLGEIFFVDMKTNDDISHNIIAINDLAVSFQQILHSESMLTFHQTSVLHILKWIFKSDFNVYYVDFMIVR